MNAVLDEATLHLLGLSSPAKHARPLPRASGSSLSEHTKTIASTVLIPQVSRGRIESAHATEPPVSRVRVESAHATAPPIQRGEAHATAEIKNKPTPSTFCFRTLIRIGLFFAFGTFD